VVSRFITIAAAVALTVAAARADPLLPDYDVVATCTATAKRLHLDPGVVSPCASSQEGYRYLLAEGWSERDPALRAKCVATNKFADYFELMLCLEYGSR
jgi:hypothetical protein